MSFINYLAAEKMQPSNDGKISVRCAMYFDQWLVSRTTGRGRSVGYNELLDYIRYLDHQGKSKYDYPCVS